MRRITHNIKVVFTIFTFPCIIFIYFLYTLPKTKAEQIINQECRQLAEKPMECNSKDPAFFLVSKSISLGNFVPQDLELFNDIYVSKRIIPDLSHLLESAKKDGLQLRVVSGYRSYDKQVQVFNSWVNKELKKKPRMTRSQAEEVANTYSARPGHSEHQLGTVVDVLSAENNYQFSLEPHFRYPAWLESNAHCYNFKISYGKNSTEYQYEPWHLRWYPPL